MDRQVRYNLRQSHEDVEKNTWWFLIINKNREIENIQKRIYSILAPIENPGRTIEGNFSRTGLRFKLLTFDSGKRVEHFELMEIYKRLVQDPHLYNRENIDGLDIYISNLR